MYTPAIKGELKTFFLNFIWLDIVNAEAHLLVCITFHESVTCTIVCINNKSAVLFLRLSELTCYGEF